MTLSNRNRAVQGTDTGRAVGQISDLEQIKNTHDQNEIVAKMRAANYQRDRREFADTPKVAPRSKRQQAEHDLMVAKHHETLQNSFTERLAGSFPYFRSALTEAMGLIGAWNAHQGFWDSENVGEKLALMHSELSEALEADRKDLPSDKIPGFTGVEEELADTVIRILDFAGHFQLRLAEALHAKLIYNLGREYRHGKGY